MPDDTTAFERFVILAKRELQAEDVRMLAPFESAPEADNVLITRLADGRHIVASFASMPADREVLARRLSMLASTFPDALAAAPTERLRARPPVATSLHEELKALATRARALEVVVIDKDSPVVWGSSSVAARPRARNALLLRDLSDRELASRFDDESGPLDPPDGRTAPAAADGGVVPPAESAAVIGGAAERHFSDDDDDDEGFVENEQTRCAVAALRDLPALEGLQKGRHLHHVERGDVPYLAVSFSGIYLLCLVYDGPFDELRAERAVAEALPRVERLVLALPPLDPLPPQPMGGVVAFRSRRRR